jgi:lysophospholipase L1-like esterase
MRKAMLIVGLIVMVAGIASADAPAWVPAMREVHTRFTGKPGTFAQFGDSITVTLAYWAGLRWDHKNMDEPTARAYKLVDLYMLKECWDKWKGPEYGSQGSMTIRWADQNIDAWLKKTNPEVALIMFGTNDLGQVKIDEYEAKTRVVVDKCLKNGTIVILSTIPPRSGRLEQCKAYAAVVKKIAEEKKVPVIDFLDECLKRRTDDWDGTKFKGEKDVYAVPTLISGDGVHPSNPKQWQGDYSDEGLKHNGFVLRNYLTLRMYAEVIETVLRPGK